MLVGERSRLYIKSLQGKLLSLFHEEVESACPSRGQAVVCEAVRHCQLPNDGVLHSSGFD